MDLNKLPDMFDDRANNDELLNLARIKRDALAKDRTTEARAQLEIKM